MDTRHPRIGPGKRLGFEGLTPQKENQNQGKRETLKCSETQSNDRVDHDMSHTVQQNIRGCTKRSVAFSATLSSEVSNLGCDSAMVPIFQNYLLGRIWCCVQ